MALVITGMEDGYIEPCGCAGLDRMKGGMARRYVLFEQLRKDGWPVVGLDVGGLIHGFGKEAMLKYQSLVESKIKMGYDCRGLRHRGPAPAGRRSGRVGRPHRPAAEHVSSTPTSVCTASTPRFSKSSRVVKAGGMTIGVTAILGKSYQRLIQQHRDRVLRPRGRPAQDRARAQVAGRSAGAAGPCHDEGSDRFGDEVPRVRRGGRLRGPGGAAGQPGDLLKIKGRNTLLVTVGHKGQNAIVLAFFADPKQPVRYQRVPLDSRWDETASTWPGSVR